MAPNGAGMTVVVIVLVVAVAVLALLVAGLLRSHAVILRRLHEAGIDVYDPDTTLPMAGPDTAAPPPPDPGTPRPNDAATGRGAPAITGVSPSGATAAYRMGGRDQDTLLVFLSVDCTTCHVFWEALADDRGATAAAGDRRLLVVTRSPNDELVATLAERDLHVPVVMSSRAWQDYEVPGSPYFIHVDGATERVRGEGTGSSWDQLMDLVDRGATETAERFAAGRRGRGRRRRREDGRPPRDSDEELRAAGIEPGDPSLYPDRSDGPSPPGRADAS